MNALPFPINECQFVIFIRALPGSSLVTLINAEKLLHILLRAIAMKLKILKSIKILYRVKGIIGQVSAPFSIIRFAKGAYLWETFKLGSKRVITSQ